MKSMEHERGRKNCIHQHTASLFLTCTITQSIVSKFFICWCPCIHVWLTKSCVVSALSISCITILYYLERRVINAKCSIMLISSHSWLYETQSCLSELLILVSAHWQTYDWFLYKEKYSNFRLEAVVALSKTARVIEKKLIEDGTGNSLGAAVARRRRRTVTAKFSALAHYTQALYGGPRWKIVCKLDTCYCSKATRHLELPAQAVALFYASTICCNIFIISQ